MSKHVLGHILESGIVSAKWERDISRTQLERYQGEQICKIKYLLEMTNCIAFLLFVE